MFKKNKQKSLYQQYLRKEHREMIDHYIDIIAIISPSPSEEFVYFVE